jgi:hypothetical protein
MIIQCKNTHAMPVSITWLPQQKVMDVMDIDDYVLDKWRQLKVIAWCNIENHFYYDAADIEWLQALSHPQKN